MSSKPTMNCDGAFPEWDLEARTESVTPWNVPEICKECEFFQFCFMNKSAKLLWLDISLSEEWLKQLVYIQRLQTEGADEKMIAAYIESMWVNKN